MESKKKVLIIKLGAIGDVIHTSVIATAIKQAHPNWEVHYFTTQLIADLVENHPHIDDFIIWDWGRRSSLSYLFKMTSLLFKNRYDIIFNLTNASRNFIMSYLAFPKKVVNKQSFGKLWVEDYFLTAKKAIKEIELPQRLYMDISSDIKVRITEKIKEYPRPYFVFAPGGLSDKNRQGRIWNINNWKELATKLTQKYGGTIFTIGADCEKELHENLKPEGVVVFSGDLNLTEGAFVLSQADLMISGDTGPIHIASAFGVKTLALLGSTSPDKIKPYGENGFYISSKHNCKYCWKKKCPYLKENETYTPCMEALSVEEVFTEVQKILN